MSPNKYIQALELQDRRDMEDQRMFKDSGMTASDEQDELMGREWEAETRRIIAQESFVDAMLGIKVERAPITMRPVGSYRRSIGLE